MRISLKIRVVLLVLLLPAFLLADQKEDVAVTIADSGAGQSVSDGEKGVCGDANDDTIINLGDISFIFSHAFGGPAPNPVSSGNVDGYGRINIRDVNYLNDYLYYMGPAPSCADTVVSGQTTLPGNGITIGCAPFAPYSGDDSVAIPVYLDNISALRAFSFGFHYPSSDVEITSVSTNSSIAPQMGMWKSYFDAANNKVSVGWVAYIVMTQPLLSPQSGGLLFTLNAQILGGPIDQEIDLDTAFVPPGGECLFLGSIGSFILPEFSTCAPDVPIEVLNLDDAGTNSLRWAIEAANTNTGPDTIIFDVSGTINLSAELTPLVDDGTVIMGSTALSGAHSIVIDGSLVPVSSGITINGDNCVIEGLTINNWAPASILINGDYNTVVNCFINVSSNGAVLEAVSGSKGIYIAGSYNTIGGPLHADKNVIAPGDGAEAVIISSGQYNRIYGNFIGISASGGQLLNTAHATGISLYLADNNYIGDTLYDPNIIGDQQYAIWVDNSNNNEICNNDIGITPSGINSNTLGINFSQTSRHNIIGPYNNVSYCTDQGIYMTIGADSNIIIGNEIHENGADGILLTSGPNHNRIGGRSPDKGNKIYNNGQNGINIYANSDSNQVIGNRIGGDFAFPDQGNLDNGLVIDFNCDGNLVDSNIIAFNANDGISVVINSRLNEITRNHIYMNGDLGIDLADDGVTFNDIGDGDSGPNDLLNFPEVDSVRYDTSDSTFVVYGTAEVGARVEAFLSHPADDTIRVADISGYGEAYEYLGFANTDSVGNFNYKVAKEFPMFSDITFTAIDVDGNTSEFSANITLDQAPLIIVGYSPINLKVIDPAGDSIGKSEDGTPFNTVGDATYDEAPNDSVNITYPLNGDYIIIVLPEEGAPPGAIYSIGIRIDGSMECIQVENANVPASGTTDTIGYVVEESYHYENGDANGDKTYNLLDILLLIDCIYGSGDVTCPEPYLSGDANCDRVLNLIDILYLIDHVYGDPPGPPPCLLE